MNIVATSYLDDVEETAVLGPVQTVALAAMIASSGPDVDPQWGNKLLSLPIVRNWDHLGKTHCARDRTSYQCRLYRAVDTAKPKEDFVHLGEIIAYKKGVCVIGAWSKSIGGTNFGTPFTLYMGEEGIDDLRTGMDARPCGK